MKKELFLSKLSLCLLIIPPSVWAVGANCKEPTSELDKRICQSAMLKIENNALQVAYYNQRAWLCELASELQHDDDWDCVEAKKTLEVEQHQWDKSVLAQCKTDDCFTRVYKARISQINGQDTPLPNFRLTTYGWGDKECQAYLKVLNRTPREDFRSCKLPDLTGSGFTTLPFKPVEGELLKQLDQQIALSYHRKQINWQDQLRKYQSGYLKLEIADVDLNKDGKNERIVKYSYPNYHCEMWEYDASPLDKAAEWELLPDEEVLNKTRNNGYNNAYFTLGVDGVISYFNIKGRNEIIRINNDFYAVSKGYFMNSVNPGPVGSKQDIKVSKFDFSKSRLELSSWCGFWYNY
ncbi:hypothetical protein ABMY35_11780 [Pseudoalteromonas sp. BZB3]|uniref:hypothetical protein n=1 Tax=Pseudoalteromonas sp. BZB3 TaxID=3136670 RepID=UPI0032C3DB32